MSQLSDTDPLLLAVVGVVEHFTNPHTALQARDLRHAVPSTMAPAVVCATMLIVYVLEAEHVNTMPTTQEIKRQILARMPVVLFLSGDGDDVIDLLVEWLSVRDRLSETDGLRGAHPQVQQMVWAVFHEWDQWGLTPDVYPEGIIDDLSAITGIAA